MEEEIEIRFSKRLASFRLQVLIFVFVIYKQTTNRFFSFRFCVASVSPPEYFFFSFDSIFSYIVTVLRSNAFNAYCHRIYIGCTKRIICSKLSSGNIPLDSSLSYRTMRTEIPCDQHRRVRQEHRANLSLQYLLLSKYLFYSWRHYRFLRIYRCL